MDFNALDLSIQLFIALDERLQENDFAIVGMDDSHHVVCSNDAKAALSGLPAERVPGRHFLSEAAPCKNDVMMALCVAGEPTHDATIEYVVTRRMRPTAVTPSQPQRDRAVRQFLLVQHV
jgi:hypothetical protein